MSCGLRSGLTGTPWPYLKSMMCSSPPPIIRQSQVPKPCGTHRLTSTSCSMNTPGRQGKPTHRS